MNSNTKIAMGGIVALGGFIAIRKLMQGKLKEKILEKYQRNPVLAGTALYSAAFGKPGRASRGGITNAAQIIAEEMIPLWGFSTPSEPDVIAYIRKKAIANAQANPQGLIDLGLEKAHTIVDQVFRPVNL